jgi:hypothetical protein
LENTSHWSTPFHSFCFQVELDKNITILKDKEQELEKAIERMSEQQPIDVDEAVTTTAPLYKQYVTWKFSVRNKSVKFDISLS